MARGINKVILIGNCTKDPETRYMPSGGAVTNISIATNESYKDKTSGEKVEKAEFHNIVFFNKTAEIAGEYLKKGQQVYIEGSLTTEKWQDKSGNDRYTTKIKAHVMQMLGGRQEPKPEGQNNQQSQSAQQQQSAPAFSGADDNAFDDSIPF